MCNPWIWTKWNEKGHIIGQTKSNRKRFKKKMGNVQPVKKLSYWFLRMYIYTHIYWLRFACAKAADSFSSASQEDSPAVTTDFLFYSFSLFRLNSASGLIRTVPPQRSRWMKATTGIEKVVDRGKSRSHNNILPSLEMVLSTNGHTVFIRLTVIAGKRPTKRKAELNQSEYNVRGGNGNPSGSKRSSSSKLNSFWLGPINPHWLRLPNLA